MWGFQRGSRLLPPLLRVLRHPRAQITSKPPEHPLSVAEQAIAFAVMTTCFLGPAAWVLAHLDHYRSRAE